MRSEEKRKKWILDFFTYGEEKEEEEEERSPVCSEIKDSRLFIGAFYQQKIKY